MSDTKKKGHSAHPTHSTNWDKTYDFLRILSPLHPLWKMSVGPISPNKFDTGTATGLLIKSK